MATFSPAKPPVALTIAGFDPSSGAGITADLQVFAAHGLFGISCITALTVQSTLGVASTHPVSALIAPTLAELQRDLLPVGIKIGMLADAGAVHAVADYLRGRATHAPVVLDPVLVSSSGRSLLSADGLEALPSTLLPLVDWITPNLEELGVLAGEEVRREEQVEPALRILQGRYPKLHIVATGGHGQTPTDTLLTPAGDLIQFEGEWVSTTSTHGTGCAFSSALLARLVLGERPEAAVRSAKAYVAEALRQAPGLGHGRGPMHLLWPCVQSLRSD